jgi:molybdopterin molybdotransferase
LLTPAALGLAASLGLESVTVYRRLRVAFFSTGNEILSPGEPPREGAVYDSNRYTLFGLLARLGVQAIDLGVVRDDPALLRAALARAAREADAIITSGGAGAGDADHMHAVLQELGDVAFWRIAMRPGRPMAAGRIQAESPSRADTASAGSYGNASILFGLPGNPVAVMVTFLAFVRPALLRMMGCKRPGRTEYQRGVVTAAADGTLQVRTTGNQGSGVLSSMVQANGLVVLHHGQGPVAAGDTVEVMMFDGAL